MSINLIGEILSESVAAGSMRLLLVTLAYYASDAGTSCYPSIERLAKETKLRERQVYKLLKKLAAGGHIVIHSGGGRHKPNHYTILRHWETLSSGPVNPEPCPSNPVLEDLKPCPPESKTLSPRTGDPDRSGKEKEGKLLTIFEIGEELQAQLCAENLDGVQRLMAQVWNTNGHLHVSM
jgi:hypothetical protein